MTRLKRIIVLVIGIELVGVGVLVGSRLVRPQPPLPNLGQRDSTTAAELEAIYRNVSRGTVEEWQQLAEAYFAYGFFPEAKLCYGRIAAMDPESAEFMSGWALCSERMGQTSEAIEQFRVAADLEDGKYNSHCWYHIGRNYLREENAAEAEKAFTKVLDFEPAAYQYAKLLIRSGRATEAIPLLDSMVQANPTLHSPFQLRALASEELGDLATATIYREQSERAPGDLRLKLGQHFVNRYLVRNGLKREMPECFEMLRDGKYADAARCFSEKIRNDSRWYLNHKVPPAAVEAQLKLSRPDDALQILDELFGRSFVTPQTWEQFGDALFVKGQEDQAVDAWNRAAQMLPSRSIHEKLAEIHSRRGNDEAMRQHRANAHHAVGVLFFRQNNLVAAIQKFADAVYLAPQNAHSWFYLGESYRFLGDKQKALEAYQHCLELNPDHGRALTGFDRLSMID